MWKSSLMATALTLVLATLAMAGPYSSPEADPTNPYDAGVPGFLGGAVNPIFVGWATGVVEYAPTPDPTDPQQPSVAQQWRMPEKALGPVTGDNFDIVSLGDLTAEQIAGGVLPGRITLSFDAPITNGPGPDFAVFENGGAWQGTIFAELGYVEVSSNGNDFARFPSVSLNTELGAYGMIDGSNVYNLVGKHANAYGASLGTPFDLANLAGDALVAAGKLDLGAVRYVRIIDIPGSGDFVDSLGHPILDVWPTVGSGGVDLEAIGVLHAVPEPAALVLLAPAALASLALRRRRRYRSQQ